MYCVLVRTYIIIISSGFNQSTVDKCAVLCFSGFFSIIFSDYDTTVKFKFIMKFFIDP